MFAIWKGASGGQSLRWRASRPEARATPEGVTSALHDVRARRDTQLRGNRSRSAPRVLALGTTEASLRARARPAYRRRSYFVIA